MAREVYVIDFDGTIMLDKEKPNLPVINRMNRLFSEGNTVLINSAASWQRYGKITAWLEEHEVSYHDLILGRPWANYYVDDRMLSIEEFTKEAQ